MAPEYGATMGFFPVDDETLRYLALSGRPEELVDLVERYCKAQGLFRTDDTPDPVFTDTLALDMAHRRAQPGRPQAAAGSGGAGRREEQFPQSVSRCRIDACTHHASRSRRRNSRVIWNDGSVVIAAITSCTNTSNPSVMVGAGLLAKKAVERGLKAKPWVKTSLAPGSKVVTRYLDEAGLTPYLEQLGFYTVGYGCTTCIGNSGPLPEEVAAPIQEKSLVVAAVISGNRNFEGRVHPLVQANYLASPPLVVAYALAGTVDIDLTAEPLGVDEDGQPVYLRDIWPSQEEIKAAIARSLRPEMYRQQYANVFSGNEIWNAVPVPKASLFAWNPAQHLHPGAAVLRGSGPEPAAPQDIRGAKVLALLGDSITTDHISPAGGIEAEQPGGPLPGRAWRARSVSSTSTARAAATTR